ncbi:hypothetical protein [Propionivibrio sp.]|uniref:hypothetical protein n=1 Tax=Propionivibrio sp. TaxID=2212460 RepID=UPI003BF2E5A5
MSLPLDNLVKISKGGLKAEPPSQSEIDGLLRSATRKLLDARIPSLGLESAFDLAYNAAHALALAALRWHGYRAENRYLVFQALPHTVGFAATQWRVLDFCHNKRNLAEYEGSFNVDQKLVNDLLAVTQELEILVVALGPVSSQNKASQSPK